MKLYYSKGACSLAVRIIINEIGLSPEFISVNLKSKTTEPGDNFLTLNPKGAVPVLQLDNKEVLTENAVILQYLADTTNSKQLLPMLGDFKRYRVLEWLNYITTELHKSFGVMFNSTIPSEIKDEIFIPLIKAKLTFVNQQLGNHSFLVDNHFTIADAYLFVILSWVNQFKWNMDEWSNLKRYFENMIQRPSIHKSLKQEDLI